MDSVLLTKYILSYVWSASHLKLQKLLYYVQGYHLAYFNAPIISDDFQAWVHWPVSRKLFATLKDKSLLYAELKYSVSPSSTETPLDKLKKVLTLDQISLVDNVLSMLGKYSGIELEEFTHWEEPWLTARKWMSPADPCDHIISKESIKVFFKKRVYG